MNPVNPVKKLKQEFRIHSLIIILITLTRNFQMPMHSVLKKLQGGDRRSIAGVDEVVGDVLESTVLFDDLIDGFFDDDSVIRMRAADAVEKITRIRPDLLKPYKKKLIRLAGDTDQQEVRWHLAQILPRLVLTPTDRKTAVEIFFTYLNDKSKIVVTFALQALADFAMEDHGLRPRVVRVLKNLVETGSPAIKNRGQKLLRMLRS